VGSVTSSRRTREGVLVIVAGTTAAAVMTLRMEIQKVRERYKNTIMELSER
jgi:hypothetical protein